MSLKDSKITKARRLTFQYKDTNIKLISQYKIDKVIPPPTSPLIKSETKSGVWYEITDAQQNIIYNRGISNAIQTDVEVFSNESDEESIIRKNVPQIEGTFSILIPDIPEAKSLSIFSNPIEKGKKSLQKSATKIFEMNLNGDNIQ
ncbi:MAG TPA: hypothetical protein VFV86_04750 [Nitrososphaeraceae archaeon]|nr:hypothetical protein [Nitrososphaeraceae archaeon]